MFSERGGMFEHVGKILLVMLLMILPVQGFSDALSSILCHASTEEAAIAAPDAEAGHDATSAHDASSNDASQHPAHTCCHHVLWALVPGNPASGPDFDQAHSFSTFVRHTLFIPEQPQRPPSTS